MGIDESKNHLFLLDFGETRLPDTCRLVPCLGIHFRTNHIGSSTTIAVGSDQTKFHKFLKFRVYNSLAFLNFNLQFGNG